jgi:hypothetical protein
MASAKARALSLPIGIGLGLACVSVLPSFAQTACVQCTGPDATYLCSTTAPDGVSEKAVGYFCMSRVARERGHRSCAVQRTATDCDGMLVHYVYDPGGAAFETQARQQERQDRDAEAREPETLGEFAEETANSSAKAIKKAGETIGDAAQGAGKATANALKGAGKAIGDATKKTLKCLGSALNGC